MFVAAFVAGMSVGMFVSQERLEGGHGGPGGPGMGFGGGPGGPGGPGGGPGGRGGPGGSWLASSLSLTAEQEQEVLKIWRGLERTGRQEEQDKRKALQAKRDESIKALVPADKHAELEKIHEAYAQQNTELSDQRRKAFEGAVEKTKAILTDEQKVKYEEILARRPGPGGPGGPGGRRGPGGPETRPATQPGGEKGSGV